MTEAERRESFARLVQTGARRSVFRCEYEENDLQRSCYDVVRHEQQWLSSLSAGSDGRFDIEYGFFESLSEVQAFAIEARDFPISAIAVSSFAWRKIMDFFFSAVANERLFADLTPADQELSSAEYSQASMFTLRPNSVERKNIAALLSTHAMRFLTAHELVHILNGHLRYKLPEAAISSMAEVRHVRTVEEALLSQTLEMDADCGAVTYSLPVVIGKERRADHLLWKTLDPRLQIPTISFRLWVFSIVSLFKLLRAVSPIAKYDLIAHPSPKVRLVTILLTVHEYVGLGESTLNNETVQQQIENALADVACAFGDGPYKDAAIKTVDQEPDILDRSKNLTRNWAFVRPLLEPFARGGKLAPMPK